LQSGVNKSGTFLLSVLNTMFIICKKEKPLWHIDNIYPINRKIIQNDRHSLQWLKLIITETIRQLEL